MDAFREYKGKIITIIVLIIAIVIGLIILNLKSCAGRKKPEPTPTPTPEVTAEPLPTVEKPEKRRTLVLKDVRIFLNTLTRSLDLMKQGGIDAGLQRQETEDALILTISIPKTRQNAT